MFTQRLRHRVAFQSPTVTQDQYGGESISWANAIVGGVPLSSVPAECLTGAGREAIQSNSKYAEDDLRVNCRWFPGLDYTWRIVWEGKNYDITSIETDVSGRKEYRIRCKAGLTDGR